MSPHDPFLIKGLVKELIENLKKWDSKNEDIILFFIYFLTLQFKTTLMVNKKSYYIIKFG
jgi:hypothetical protein